jgi:hypothetical protein
MARRRVVGIGRKGLAALASLAMAIACGAMVSCGADDNALPPIVVDASPDSTTEAGALKDGATEEAAPVMEAGHASMQLSAATLDFPMLPCGGDPAMAALTVMNNGGATLAVSVRSTGDAFMVTPTALSVPAGMSGMLTVTATLPGAATAGLKETGSLGLFTNDPANKSVMVPLSATASGAQLGFQMNAGNQMAFSFPETPLNNPAIPLSINFVNLGNGPGTFTFSPPSDPAFSLLVGGMPATGGVTLNPNDTLTLTANFTPSNSMPLMATSTISGTGTCTGSVQSVSFTGQGGVGAVSGWPTAPLDFGNAACGGAAPAAQTFTLTNGGAADARISQVTISGGGFTTDAKVGRKIAGGGGVAVVTVTPPAVPNNSATTAITGTLTLLTDVPGDSPHTITLTEEPTGAVLAFDTSQTPNFGNLGAVALLSLTTQDFKVTNTGTGPADVTLTVVQGSPGDGGTDEAGLTDAGGSSSPFSLSVPSFTIAPNGTPEAETLTFEPATALPVTGSIVVTAKGSICGALPAPLPLSGSGLGGGPTVTPTSVTLSATCGGQAPTPQTFLVRNDGTADFTWSLTTGAGVQIVAADAGAGDAQADGEAGAPPLYTVSANPGPGTLIPGASSIVTVTGLAIPMGGANPAPSAYAAQITISTDVPLDPPHVVSINEMPLGDQLVLQAQVPMRFGQVPLNTSLDQLLSITNQSTSGSPAANVTFTLTGAGAAAYALSPGIVANIAPGSTFSPIKATFKPTAMGSYPATLSVTTTDPVCTPLPAPVQISGTGTDGVVTVSTASLFFGTDPNDKTAGFVACGATGLTQTLTVSNGGNQVVHITGLTLGKGASSPFTVSSSTMTLGIDTAAAPATLTITPSAIPATVANPSDPAQFSDALTITTDAAGDSPHSVNLFMQARGAVISNESIAATWPFGIVSYGSIGTITSTMQNTGNAPATIALTGQAQPTIFTLLAQPETIAGHGLGGAYTQITGEFVPPAANGSWTDQGTLVLTAPEGFCGAPPMGWSVITSDAGTSGAQQQWTGPTIQVSGSSNSAPAVTIAGSLAFTAINCGDGTPAPQGVTLTSQANVDLPFTVSFTSGKFYTAVAAVDGGTADGGTGQGVLHAHGTSSILVQPNPIVPGNVVPGSAPFADNLLIAVESPGADAASPALASFAVPVSWTVNGAVFSLPSGFTKTDGLGKAFYPADTASGFTLPMANKGTAAASVSFSGTPSGVFVVAPMPPIQILQNSTVGPQLSSTSSDVACSAAAADAGADAGAAAVTESTVQFFYTGPVCQFFPAPTVTVGACSGTFP